MTGDPIQVVPVATKRQCFKITEQLSSQRHFKMARLVTRLVSGRNFDISNQLRAVGCQALFSVGRLLVTITSALTFKKKTELLRSG